MLYHPCTGACVSVSLPDSVYPSSRDIRSTVSRWHLDFGALSFLFLCLFPPSSLSLFHSRVAFCLSAPPDQTLLLGSKISTFVEHYVAGRHCFEHFTRIDLIKPYNTLWGRYYYVSFHFIMGTLRLYKGSSRTGQVHVISKCWNLDLSAGSLCTHHKLPEKCWFLTRSRTFVPLVEDVHFSRKPPSQLT